MFQYSLEIVFADRVKNPAASALLDDPESSFSRAFDSWLHSTNLAHVCKVLTCERSIPTASCNHNVFRITTATFIAYGIYALRLDLRASRRISKAFQQIASRTFLCPRRQQCCLDARA